jgi:RHS repeat-associated protein
VDNAGNRTAKTDELAGVTSNYSYDAIYELTQVTQGTTTTESYTFDPVGNRLSSLGVSSYTNNSSNELTSSSSSSYTYDYNGNTLTSTTGSNTTSYAWDFENRLTSVTLPGSEGTVSFKYDPFGRRIYKSSSSATSVFAYDNDGNLVEETTSAGTTIARYAHGLNIDEPLAMLRSSTTSYYDADGLGSITSLSSGVGALAQTYTFDSFGKQTASSGSLTNPFQYTAREFDPETSLYYYRARYYGGSMGRFVSEDPGRFPGGINFYTYVENTPVNLIDPFGFCPWQIHDRPLKGVPGAGKLGLDHFYFYNTQTGQSLGLGPAGGFSGDVLTGDPVPGTWERDEKPGHKIGEVPDFLCGCVDRKVRNPGDPPKYCTFNGNGKPNNVDPHPACPNCAGWIMGVLQDCRNQARGGSR